MKDHVKVWEEIRDIPTYGVGEPDKNPMFLEKRVYQGSSGRVYPHPVIDKIENDKKSQPYKLIILENDYIRIEVLPELGGRIYRALDKTNDYDFVYHNQVIKPALVGLTGPWISGGIEFNWPQHHRPNTFGPVEYRMETDLDGSCTVWVGEIDRMYGTKVTTGFRLFPERAYLEIEVILYNRTAETQTFLWWANPAIPANDYTQSVFPPDVNAVFDHGKRDVSKFPIATGTYYKIDYSEGVDISRYKNIPVPTSYMAYRSDYNFVGAYDNKVEAGLLHVANHHVSPGKKQWTWGNGDFGQAWDRQLTDVDGPYIELMTGVYTDNQPDFTWLQPYEEKSFKQYFMPYKEIGIVKNATIDAAVNLEVDEKTQKANVQVYATSDFKGAVVELKGKQNNYINETINLSPNNTYTSVIKIEDLEKAHDLRLTVKNDKGKVLVSYQPKKPDIEKVPEAAEAIPTPEELKTIEELYLAGLHLEQYRHATFEPENYYLEGLKRNPNDIRINVAYGKLWLRRGKFKESESYFLTAIRSLKTRNPNPYDGEAFYQLGVALKMQGKLNEAFAAFYKATWSAAWQESGYFSLAQIATRKGDYEEALELINRSLIRNNHNFRARVLKTAILRRLGYIEEAKVFAKETLQFDRLDFGSHNEVLLLERESGEVEQAKQSQSEINSLMRKDVFNHLALADDYQSSGLLEEAIDVLLRLVPDETVEGYPMLHYALSYLFSQLRQSERAEAHRASGMRAKPDYCFPNCLFELLVLEDIIRENPKDHRAHYYLGNLLYDKKRHTEAIEHWEISRDIYHEFPTVHRNLALGYYNKLGNAKQALQELEVAFQLNLKDARVFYELDQLCKRLNYKPEQRLVNLENYMELVLTRDDLYIEYVSLLNILGRYENALIALQSRIFHPWEGGEGKVTRQYVFANVELGKEHLKAGDYDKAIDYLTSALKYPLNLGEGKLAGAQENDIFYYLGCAYEKASQSLQAKECFQIASLGLHEPKSAMYYNDQPPEMIFYQGLAWIKLNNEKEAKRRFNKLIDYGESHIFDKIKIDYFAVSLPDFLVFEDDLSRRNRIHCKYMMGLGHLGLSQYKKALNFFDEVLVQDTNHQGALLHKRLCKYYNEFVQI
ncbi:DUF5107 domain-containing protein [Neobacillus jeddahensis]|uniref:DUF5107 domain-containing protein n=1 Tax=Neobacillus jeddahensis TaxID=1461580 RepID=UPI000590CCAD|nr:DUF5107 domain-containing protein [Neobacillus jeddahensis]